MLKLGLHISSSRALNGAVSYPYSTELNNALIYADNNTITHPGSSYLNKLDTLIDSVKTAGVWTKMDAIYVMAHDSAAFALVNLKNPGVNNLTNNSCTHSSTLGYYNAASAIANYLGTGINFADANLDSGYNLKRDDLGVCYYITQARSVSARDAVCGLLTDNAIRIKNNWSTTSRFNSGANISTSHDGSGTGVFGYYRITSNNINFIKDTTVTALTSASAVPASNEITLLLANSTVSENLGLGVFFLGKSLTTGTSSEHNAMQDAIITYFTV